VAFTLVQYSTNHTHLHCSISTLERSPCLACHRIESSQHMNPCSDWSHCLYIYIRSNVMIIRRRCSKSVAIDVSSHLHHLREMCCSGELIMRALSDAPHRLCAGNRGKATPGFCPSGSSTWVTSFNFSLKADAIWSTAIRLLRCR